MKNNTTSVFTQQKIVLHSQVALPKEYSNFLKEGNLISVKILKHISTQSSKNIYIASFVGGRFSIKSSSPLVVGSRFMARVSFLDGKLNLIRQENENQVAELNQKLNFTSTSSLSPELSQLLLSLGLPSDNVSKILLQSTVNFGIKLNLEKIKKARFAASQFPGREEEASEAALILIEKGIAPTKENLLQILSSFELENSLSENSVQKEFIEIQNEQNQNILIEEIKSEIKNYFNLIFSEKNNFENNFEEKSEIKIENEKNEEKKLNQKSGFLTIFNHLATRENPKENLKSHWILLPFNFNFQKFQKNYNGDGLFRIFFDVEKKNVKKIIVNFEVENKIWNFSIKFNLEKIQKINFSFFDPNENSNKNPLEEKIKLENVLEKEKSLSKIFGGAKVQYEPPENLIGFANKIESLAIIKGFA